MLKKDNIILRQLKDSDKIILAKLANNKNVWDNLRDYIPYPYSIENAELFINQTRNEDIQLTFAIDFGEDLSGIIGLIKQTDVYKNTAEIGYWIGEPYWNKGIATIAVELITEYGFKELKLNRIHTGIFEYNLASMKVLEKNGFQKDGIFKKAIIKNNQLWDEYRYSKVVVTL